MSTVEDTARDFAPPQDEWTIRGADLEAAREEPLLAQRLAWNIAAIASDLMPGHRWTVEELRELFEIACSGPSPSDVQLIEGRYFRKRLKEQCSLAERYDDNFACVVFRLRALSEPSLYESVLDAITDRLRCTDMVFLYRRRIALVLPRTPEPWLEPLIERVRKLVSVGAGVDAVEGISRLVYPGPGYPNTEAVLEWAEDQLR